ncbi:hypothetical protein GGX14DRAFT_407274 [Mycena pura]|uniref:Uncharacterized protein n=1 Tax=Mycena pura TaxID=153505 RepID=A0AAD6UNQ6_9AGAR|nr:hypothetical protein GGX14DRAFT_407274 [Mycena pura]
MSIITLARAPCDVGNDRDFERLLSSGLHDSDAPSAMASTSPTSSASTSAANSTPSGITRSSSRGSRSLSPTGRGSPQAGIATRTTAPEARHLRRAHPLEAEAATKEGPDERWGRIQPLSVPDLELASAAEWTPGPSAQPEDGASPSNTQRGVRAALLTFLGSPARSTACPLDRLPARSTAHLPTRPTARSTAYPPPRPLACRSPARTAPGNEPRGVCEYLTVTRREHRSWARRAARARRAPLRARAPANRRDGFPPAASAACAGRALRAGPVLARRARYGRGHPLRHPRDARGRAPPVGGERDACGVSPWVAGDEMQTIHELAAAFTAPSATAPSTQLGPILGRLPVRVHRIQHASVAKSSAYPSSQPDPTRAHACSLWKSSPRRRSSSIRRYAAARSRRGEQRRRAMGAGVGAAASAVVAVHVALNGGGGLRARRLARRQERRRRVTGSGAGASAAGGGSSGDGWRERRRSERVSYCLVVHQLLIEADRGFGRSMGYIETAHKSHNGSGALMARARQQGVGRDRAEGARAASTAVWALAARMGAVRCTAVLKARQCGATSCRYGIGTEFTGI